MRRWRIAVGTVLVTAVVIALHATRPDAPGPGSDCEAIGEGLLRQPGNSLSALALVVVGAAVTASASRPRRLVGAGTIVAGVAATLAHATQHPVALAADGFGVAVVLVAITAALIAASAVDWVRVGVAAAVAAAGLTLWAASRSGGPLCDPDVFFGGHAVWHLLAAAALLLGASSISDQPRNI